MDFQQSVDYLLSLGFERSVKKFGLENTTILLDALGNPQNNFLKVQIAGTNGKGSTCAFLESICVQADIDVGVNTSPHLVSVTERIRVNGQRISEKEFARYATRIREVSEKLVEDGKLPGLPTFFEHVTAIAQLVFAEAGIKVAILEVGLGGRFDATTATVPEIVGITPISMDHVKTLGPRLKDIAAEKAATIHPAVRIFSVPQEKVAEEAIRRKCIDAGIKPVWAVPNVRKIDPYGVLRFEVEENRYDAILVGMPGKHQWVNATLAICIAEALREWQILISKADIEVGLEAAEHAGRLEFSDGILFDGAHNVEGVKALVKYLKEFVTDPITMVYGTSGGKDIEKIAELLFPMAENLIITTAENPRAFDAAEYLDVAEEYAGSVYHVEGVGNAVEKAREIVGDGLLLVTGSLYLIGEVKAYLADRGVERRKKKKD